MKTSHTPGPWKVNPTGDVGNWIVGTDSAFIADCSGENVPNEEYIDNARLIASAPTLLCMLQRLLDEVMMEETVFSKIASLTLEQTRKVLAEATGNEV